jgi:predicted ester cyclase
MSTEANTAQLQRLADEVLTGHNLAALDEIFHAQGTHQGSFLGIRPTGKNVAVAAWTIDRFTDGKIAESRIIMDTLGMMQQLGIIPSPAE